MEIKALQTLLVPQELLFLKSHKQNSQEMMKNQSHYLEEQHHQLLCSEIAKPTKVTNQIRAFLEINQLVLHLHKLLYSEFLLKQMTR